MSSLQEQLIARRPECFESGTSDRSFIEFQLTPGTRQGFAIAQLLHYTLEPEADAVPAWDHGMAPVPARNGAPVRWLGPQAK